MASQLTSEDDGDDNQNGDTFRRIDRDLKRSYFTVFPDSSLRTIWDINSCILIVHLCIILPLQITFSDFNPDYIFSFERFSEAWFFLDIFINFNTGYYDKGVLIME